MGGGGAQRGGVGTEDLKLALCNSSEPDDRFKPRSLEIMTGAYVRHSTVWATQAPYIWIFKMVQNSANAKGAIWVFSVSGNSISYSVSLTEGHIATQMIPHCLTPSSLCCWCWVKFYSSFKILVKSHFIWISCPDLDLSGAFNHTLLYRALLYSTSSNIWIIPQSLNELHISPYRKKYAVLFKYDLKVLGDPLQHFSSRE